MRIVVAHSHLNTFGGGERATLELIQRLRQRHAVTLWAGSYRPNATYAAFADLPRRDLAPLDWLIRTPQADAVVAHTFGANLLALHHPHVICYLHTLRSVYAQGGMRPDLVARRALERCALRSAPAILTNSAYTASRAGMLYGLPRERIEVVPLGANETYFTISPTVGSYALSVGRLAPEKGVERLLAWSADLPLDLLIVGDGPADYVARLRRLSGPRVTFAGPLEGEALREAYADCRFFAFLPYAEEFGLVALDALAAGKPVVAAREGGLAALVEDDVSGYLVSDEAAYRTAALRLLGDDALCLRMGEAGRVQARAYSWDAYAARIEALCMAPQQA
ncbi:MAG: glycosyltransferase family 4 protein [Ktedonobacterales bacterium]